MWRRTAKAILAAVIAAWALSASAARAQLPDGRRYELVSPSAKLGNDVIAESSRTRAAAAEAPGLPMAVAFASLGGFADVRGTGISTEYLAQRTAQPGTSGWTTHAITPAQQSLTIAGAAQSLDPLYEGDMSADLTKGVFRAWSPLTPAANVLEVENLYSRDDLRTPGAGAYRLLTDAAAPLAPIRNSSQRPYLAAASADFRHVLFESRQALTLDAVRGNVMLYKADDGVVRLLAPVAGCPGGFAAAAPCAVAGAGVSGLHRTARTLSSDGSRALVTAPVTSTGSVSNGGTGTDASQLYELDDRGTPDPADDVTLHVNASELQPPATSQSATFETASTDAERVFFSSAEQLTRSPGGGLYLWRRQAGTNGEHLTLIAPGALGAIGAAQDGRRVYLVAGSQLVPGGPAVSEAGIFLWEDDGSAAGRLSFVGGIGFGDASANINAMPWNLVPRVSRVTPDGGALLFEVSDGRALAPRRVHGSCPGGNPNAGSNGRCSELYLYRAEDSTPLAPDVRCVSCGPPGTVTEANALVNVRAGAGASQVTWHLSRALSADGRRVFFSTAAALAPGDANGRVDAYEYDADSDAAHLLSSGTDTADAYFLDASASGDDVFLLTRERLSGWDTDEAYDVYDARVGGGFPDPPAPAPPCVADGCHGTPRAPPPPPTLGSSVFAGAGTRHARAAPRAKRCRSGHVRKRVHGRARCVKRRHPARRSGRRR